MQSLSENVSHNHLRNPQLRDLGSRIRDYARAQGFDLVGIVPAEVLSRERELLEEWLARGYHGEMSWMARDPDMRTDPRKIFPEARSVIVVAINYYTPENHSQEPDSG